MEYLLQKFIEMGKYLTLVIFLTFFDSSSLFSQVGGRIVDAKTKQPLVGANIYTDLGVGVSVADKKGEFMINNGELLRDADTLCFSFVGYCTKRFSVTSLLQKKNVILLQEEPFALGEVTVYGIKKSYLRLPYTQISSIPVPLYSFAMISLEKKLYLTGGDRSQIKPPMGFSLTGSGGLPSGFVYEKYSNKIYVYDIISNTWTIINKKLRERAYHSALYNDGKIYVWVENVFQRIGRLSILMKQWRYMISIGIHY